MEKINSNDLKCRANKYTYHFQQFQSTKPFCDKIRINEDDKKNKATYQNIFQNLIVKLD